jgi:site-specific DNA-methyltransferase (adenine-specific)
VSHATYLVGDVFDRMAELPDGSIDLVMTSPPFLALRSYLPADHPDKDKEIGSEPTPAAFLDTLLALTAEWRRVLAPHGSICVELGDTYSGSGGHGGDYAEDGLREGQPKFGGAGRAARQAGCVDAWPLAKSLAGIPHLYHLSLAYGRNILTGEPSPAGQWRVRNVVAWARPNPPVGALGDKFRPATSYVTIACVGASRYFDLDAVRSGEQSAPGGSTNWHPHDGRDHRGYAELGGQTNTGSNPAGAPPLDWWDEIERILATAPDDLDHRGRARLVRDTLEAHHGPSDLWEIPTAPYKGSHYATFPPALVRRPVEAMCPRRVCRTCGKPSERIVEVEQQDTGRTTNGAKPRDRAESFAGTTYATRTVSSTTTLGWSDCGHNDYRNGVVLDPFGGSGTTAEVATGLGRDAVLIDLDARNAELARERVGLFLDVDYGTTKEIA